MAGLLKAMRLDSIRNKLTALVLVAVLVPTLTTAGVSYLQNKRSLTDKASEELESVGSHTARELNLWTRQQFYDVGVFSSSFEVTENLELLSARGNRRAEAQSRLQDYVTTVEEHIPDYRTLKVLNEAGELVASSDGSSAEMTLPEEWRQPLRSGQTQLGEPAWDETQGAVLATLAEPVSSANTARYLGALVAELDFHAVSKHLAEYAPGTTGKAHLVNADGRVITSSEGPSVTNANLSPSVMKALLATPDQAVEYEDLSGEPVLGTLHSISGTKWSVVAEMDRAEAYAPINRLRNVTILLVLGLLAVIGAVAYLLGLFIVLPLARLTDGAAEVASGDLSVGLPNLSGGELAELTSAFNHMVQRLREGREELEQLSITDGLTGLVNHRRGMEVLVEALEAARVKERPLGLLLMDVDHFKRYNDTHGHLEGDEVLKGVARAVEDAVRVEDTSCRYGGEEFLVVLPDCDEDGTLEIADRIRARLAAEVFAGGAVTMSFGAAVFPAQGTSPKELIEAADHALYKAKDLGRDRIILEGHEGRSAADSEQHAAARIRTSKRPAGAAAV